MILIRYIDQYMDGVCRLHLHANYRIVDERGSIHIPVMRNKPNAYIVYIKRKKDKE